MSWGKRNGADLSYGQWLDMFASYGGFGPLKMMRAKSICNLKQMWKNCEDPSMAAHRVQQILSGNDQSSDN